MIAVDALKLHICINISAIVSREKKNILIDNVDVDDRL
jgi:hypothetical protein